MVKIKTRENVGFIAPIALRDHTLRFYYVVLRQLRQATIKRGVLRNGVKPSVYESLIHI